MLLLVDYAVPVVEIFNQQLFFMLLTGTDDD